MKIKFNLFVPIFLLAGVALTAAEPTSEQLQALLARFPAADANHDGILTAEEARAYQAQRSAQKKKAPQVENENPARPAPTYADLKYGPYASNVVDLWLAKSDQPTPLIVFIHGGGFTGGDKHGVDVNLLNEALARGVSFMSINYRFRSEAPIQDILRDCARSIQFVRYHAKEYHFDPKRVVSFGGSAGAGSSLWLDFHPDLADPKNPDPVLRESSRILGAGAIGTQATYDMVEWEQKIGKFKPEWQTPGEIAQFYNIKDADVLTTPEGQKILDDTSMLRLVTHDDGPVFMYSNMPDGEPTDRGHLLHHPNHARAVKAACDAAGVPAVAYFLTVEPHPPEDFHVLLSRFLFAQLKVPAAPAQ